MDPIETEDVVAPPSIREGLEAAVTQLSEEPAGDVEVKEPVLEDLELGEGEEKPADERPRDETGKFTKAEKAAKAAAAAKSVVKPVAVKPIVKPGAVVKPAAPGVVPTSAQQAPAVPEMKAPQAWREPAKKVWAALPEAARVEVLRREKEVAQTLATAAEDRKYAHTLRQTVAPFEAQIRAEGSTPEQAIGKLLATGMALRTAPPAHKAKLVAGMINDFGIDLNHLVAELQGTTPAPGQQQQQLDPNAIVQQVTQSLEKRFGQQREQALVQQSSALLEKFLEDKPMHGLDGTDYSAELREEMADIIEVAARRGKSITLERAYTLAAQEHPEVSKVLERQKAAAAATKKNQSQQQVRAAASSVRSSPATTPVSRGQTQSLRESLEAAVEDLES